MSKRLFLILMLTLSATFCLAEEANQKSRQFTVGVESFGYAPHYFIDHGRFSGFGRDVLDLFAKKKGYVFRYQARPYVRMVEELLTGKIDFQYPDNPDWLPDQKNEKKIYYSNAVNHYVDGIVRRKEDIGKPIATLKRIAMPRGWTPVDYLPMIQRGELKVDEADQVESVMNMLLAKRVDGIYLSAEVATTFLKEHGQSQLAEFDSSLPYQFSQYSLSSISHPEVIREFNQFLVDSAEDIQRIKAGYQFRFDSNPQKSKK